MSLKEKVKLKKNWNILPFRELVQPFHQMTHNIKQSLTINNFIIYNNLYKQQEFVHIFVQYWEYNYRGNIEYVSFQWKNAAMGK